MVPGKLYEYLDAGRQLVALLEGDDEAAALVLRADGTVTAPGDRSALATVIEQRYLAWKAGAVVAPRRPEWLEQHTREALTARLARLLDGLVRERR